MSVMTRVYSCSVLSAFIASSEHVLIYSVLSNINRCVKKLIRYAHLKKLQKTANIVTDYSLS